MSEAEIQVADEDTTYTVDTETGEILNETEPEPVEPETEDEPAEDTEPDEGGDAGEPQSATVRTDREMEQVFKSLERLRKDTAKRVGNIFGDDATQLMECPLCAAVAPGYLWPQDIAPLAEEQVAALRMMLNMPVATDYVQSEAFQACPKCEGLGRVRTGSKVHNHDIAECPTCFAKGYVGAPVKLSLVNGNGVEHEENFTTGPTVYGHELPGIDTDTQAVIQSLRDRGFVVAEPLGPARPAL